METLTREQIEARRDAAQSIIDASPEGPNIVLDGLRETVALCDMALRSLDDAMEFAMMFATPKQQGGWAEVEREGYAEWKLLGIDRRKPQLIMPDSARSTPEELVKRLRDKDSIVIHGMFHCIPVMREAADFIERTMGKP